MATEAKKEEATVMQVGIFSMSICVPAEWTDDEAIMFARREPCGTSGGWQLREDAKPAKRVPCKGRAGFVHMIFDA